MAVKLPNGVLLALATAYGTPLTMSVVSNANPAVATVTDTTTLADGNYVEVTSGWSRLNQRIVRVAGVSASPETFQLEGINTTDAEDYPAGSGTGSVREVSTWTQISQVLELTASGGDQQFVTYSFLEQDFESQLPTVQSPITMTMQIADDPTLAGYIALKAAADSRELTAMRATLPDGSKLVYNGYVSFNETPTMTKNQLMAVTATFSLQSRPVRYAT